MARWVVAKRTLTVVSSLTLVAVVVVLAVVTSSLVSNTKQAPQETKASGLDDEFSQINCDKTTNADLRISAGDIAVRTGTNYAGAITFVSYKGKQFINNHDHGRQLQYALSANGYGECYNPTEAGNGSDGSGSSSRFLEGCVLAPNKYYSKSQMAFWLKPGQSGYCSGGATHAINTKVLSDYTLSKIVEIGYNGMPNVIRIALKLHIPENVTGYNIETPTGYLNHEFNKFYSYNPATETLKHYTQADSDPLFGPFTFVKYTTNIPILSDGTYSMAAYARLTDTAYNLADYAGDYGPTTKWNIVYSRGATTAGDYYYESFVVVGEQTSIPTLLNQLLTNEPQIKLPKGYFDSADCNYLSGWTCDTSDFSQPVSVEVYADAPKGAGGVYITTFQANQQREQAVGDLCGGNRNHGFYFVTPIDLKTGQPRKIYLYAVNIGQAEDGQTLLTYSPRTITCQAPTPSVTNPVTPTASPSASPTATNSPSPSPSASVSPTVSPTLSPSPSATLSPSPSATVSPTVSPTVTTSVSEGVQCGAADYNGDNRFTLLDFIDFARVYNQRCADSVPATGCGAKDFNGDGKITILDFIHFAGHYNQASCS